MKNLFLVIVFFALLGCSGQATDSDNTAPPEAFVEFHLQSYFKGEIVRLEWDGRVVFHGPAVTLDVWSLAEIIELESTQSMHHLAVEVNDKRETRIVIADSDSTFVLIRYYREDLPGPGIEKGIYIDVTAERPLYD